MDPRWNHFQILERFKANGSLHTNCDHAERDSLCMCNWSSQHNGVTGNEQLKSLSGLDPTIMLVAFASPCCTECPFATWCRGRGFTSMPCRTTSFPFVQPQLLLSLILPSFCPREYPRSLVLYEERPSELKNLLRKRFEEFASRQVSLQASHFVG